MAWLALLNGLWGALFAGVTLARAFKPTKDDDAIFGILGTLVSLTFLASAYALFTVAFQ